MFILYIVIPPNKTVVKKTQKKTCKNECKFIRN